MAPSKKKVNSSNDNKKQLGKITRSKACRSDPTTPYSQDNLKNVESGRQRVTKHPAKPSGAIPKRIGKTKQPPAACNSMEDIPQPPNHSTLKNDFPQRRIWTLNEVEDEISLEVGFAEDFASIDKEIAECEQDVNKARQKIEDLETYLPIRQKEPSWTQCSALFDILLQSSKESLALKEEWLREALKRREDTQVWYASAMKNRPKRLPYDVGCTITYLI